MEDAALADAVARLRERLIAEDACYPDYHARRFDYLMALVERLAPPGAEPHVLDVGAGPFTDRLQARYAQVCTLGFPLEGGEFRGRPHLPYDLNWAGEARPIETSERFDLIVFAEVIEHLHVPPEVVLPALLAILRPGGFLIVQTPNAAALVKRVALLLGIQPYDPLRVDRFNPGHFREYTRRELADALEGAGFEVLTHAYASYFPRPPARGLGLSRVVLNLLMAAVPAFRDGQSFVARRR